MVTMTQALQQITADLPEQLNPQQIERARHEAGHTWRRRLLDPVTTVYLLLIQVLHHNTACAHLPHLSGLTFSASGYCQARRRLPLAVLTRLLARLTEAARIATDQIGRWHGHRTFLIDGSACSMPDTPTHAARFGKPIRPGRAEPRAVKRGRNRYPWMIQPRHVLRQELLQHDDAA